MTLAGLGALIGLAIAGYALFTARGTHLGGIPPQAVALVNQRPILRSDFMTQTEAQYLVPFSQTSAAQRQRVLGDMINEELLMQRGLELDLPSYDPDVRNALVAGVDLEVVAEVIAQQPTPEQMRVYYDSHTNRYSSDGLMQMRDLIVKNSAPGSRDTARARAESAAAELRAGRPVDEVIKSYGLTDSGRFMAAGHTDLGDIFQFAVRAKVDDRLYDALSPLKDGETSGAVEEADGIHIVLMIKHRFPVAQTFEEATNRIWMDVRLAAEERVRAANLAYLHGRANIVVAPDYVR